MKSTGCIWDAEQGLYNHITDVNIKIYCNTYTAKQILYENQENQILNKYLSIEIGIKNMNISIKYNQEHVSTAMHCKHNNKIYWYWLPYSNSVLHTTTTYYDTDVFSMTRNNYSLTATPLLPWAQQSAMVGEGGGGKSICPKIRISFHFPFFHWQQLSVLYPY